MGRYETLRAGFASAEPPRSLFPLLWLHGDERETEEVLRAEIQAMDDAGSGGFVIESRPHNDYLGDGWWRDLDICLDEAKRRGMEVWLFDEEYYPSGIAGGRVLASMPDYRMQVLAKETTNWQEAEDLGESGNDFTAWLKIVAVPHDARAGERLSFTDRDAWLEWCDAQSTRAWTFHLIGIKPSWSGRMFDKMVDYLTPEVTDCFLELTYEQTRQRYPEYWGTTIKGFFGDETSFENFGSYDSLFGEDTPCMPWSRILQERFQDLKHYDLLSRVEYLWLEDGGNANETAEVRVDFMDVMTTLFSENFFGRIQKWCHAHGVQFIGHVVEDNHAHMHHGYGVGHFFRTTRHFDMGGYDFVLRQLDSEQKQLPYEEQYPRFNTYRDDPYPDFFHYTLAKLAQSAAHLEVGTDLVMCENFGAYGWDLGLREMKWLTDWMTVRGTTWYVPHAFSPLFPDPDCPPHFFAGGRNPQWPHFRQWGDYANRSIMMLRDAVHVSRIAVLYPAEAHWAGDRDCLDGACRTLTRNQYDFDILSVDLLLDADRAVIGDGRLSVGAESFATILLPNIRSIPAAAVARLQAFVQAGGQVLLVTDTARDGDAATDTNTNTITDASANMNENAYAKAAPKITDRSNIFPACGLEELAAHLAEAGVKPVVSLSKPFGDLNACHYRHEDADVFFLNNEQLYDALEDTVTFPIIGGIPEIWLPMTGETRPIVAYDETPDGLTLPIRLAPYEACFVVIRNGSTPHRSLGQLSRQQWFTAVQTARGGWVEPVQSATYALPDWTVTGIATPLEYETLPEASALTVGDWTKNPALAKFSGSLTYETTVDVSAEADGFRLDLGEAGETATASVNGIALGTRICPPYVWDIPSGLLQAGSNKLSVVVASTLGAYFAGDEFARKTPHAAGLLGPAKLTAFSHVTIEA